MTRKEMLQCMKGTHPYIKRICGENGKQYFHVKTLDDEQHLSDLSAGVQNVVLDWIYWNFYPAHKLYPHAGSSSLGIVLKNRTQIVLTNNQFKEAMLMNGFWPRDPKEVNWIFYIQAGSPAVKMQADGYPGLPIFGRQDLNLYSRLKKL